MAGRMREWRSRNPEKRNQQRKRYYDKHDYGYGRRSGNWKLEDVEKVLRSDLSDVELAKRLHRSVMAVQVKRSKTKGKY